MRDPDVFPFTFSPSGAVILSFASWKHCVGLLRLDIQEGCCTFPGHRQVTLTSAYLKTGLMFYRQKVLIGFPSGSTPYWYCRHNHFGHWAALTYIPPSFFFSYCNGKQLRFNARECPETVPPPFFIWRVERMYSLETIYPMVVHYRKSMDSEILQGMKR